MRTIRGRRLLSILAGLAVALAAAGVLITRSLGSAGDGLPNDSSIFGVDPADLTRQPPMLRTIIASDLATRAVLIKTPPPTPSRRTNPNLLMPQLGPGRAPVGGSSIGPATYPGAGSSALYLFRNGWSGPIAGETVEVSAGAKKLDYGSNARLRSLVLVIAWPVDFTSPSFEEFNPAANYGPLHVVSFDANGVLTLQPDDGSVNVYFDVATRRFLARPSDAPPLPPSPTHTPAPAPGAPRLRVARPLLHDGRVEVPIVAEGTGFADYAGFRIHLRWDAAVFRFGVADSIWGEFSDATCIKPVVDPDGAGVVFACSGQRRLTQFSSGVPTQGLLAIVALEPVGTGCSALHLDPAGARLAGSFTADKATSRAQADTYMDGTSGANGSPCDAPTLTAASAGAPASPGPTPTPGGPAIVVGAPSLDGGHVVVPINSAGPWPAAYSGFSVHLRWDPTVFTFASASPTGGVLPSPVCPSAVVDADGGGAVFACASTGGGTRTTGLLASFSLTGRSGAACSVLHLYTYGGADNGDTTSGTFTVDVRSFTPQIVSYVDGSASTSGTRC